MGGCHFFVFKNVEKLAGAVMYVLAQVFDPREDIKTKTHSTSSGQAHKTPDGSVSAAVSENSSDGSTGSPQRLDSSATQSSAAIDNGNSTSSGKKQESFTSTGLSTGSLRNQNHSLVVTDWQTRWSW